MRRGWIFKSLLREILPLALASRSTQKSVLVLLSMSFVLLFVGNWEEKSWRRKKMATFLLLFVFVRDFSPLLRRMSIPLSVFVWKK